MRRRLVLLALATTSMVALAFLVPLGLLVRTLARDRALYTAEQEASALAPVLALTSDVASLEPAVDATEAGRDGRLTVFLPDGTIVGAQAVDDEAVALASRGRAFTARAPGGMQVLLPVALPSSGTAVVRVLVPDALLLKGVARSWTVLASVGLAMLLVAVVVADRLALGTVRPVRDLAEAAARLAHGDLAARVTPRGPPEVAEVGRAFNRLADRVNELLDAERERVADLSHRLRTPLTALRLELDAVRDREDAIRLAEAIESLERTVDQIIRAARRPVREGLDVTDLVAVTRERVAFWAALAEEQGRPWSLEADDSRPVPVHREELEAAFDALIGNVFAHTPEGTPFRVTVEAGPDGGSLLVVQDDGPGVPAAGLVRRGASTAGSTGLGLDIARRTAEGAGGRLEIRPGPDGGTRVELELPGPPGPRTSPGTGRI